MSNFRNLGLISVAFCAAAAVQAAPITYAINVDLSSFHAGSFYSGSVLVPNALTSGGSTPIALASNPGSQYSPSPLNATLSVGPGPSGFNSVFISQLAFTDTSTSTQYLLIVNGAAHCDVIANPNGIPCQTNGQLIGGNANGGVATYSVTIGPAAVPEPATGLPLLAAGLIGVVAVYRRSRSSVKG